uniref:hypothetical protein n=1 Tax=Phenylobacterium sp. TaxID=1871053 RepID=UPI002FE20A4D
TVAPAGKAPEPREGSMKAKALTVTALVVAGGVVAVAVLPQDGGLDYRDMPAAGVKVATALFVVALFLERSLAVLNGLLFPEGPALERKVVDPMLSATCQRGAQDELDQVKARKARVRMAAGFVFALAIAAAGTRTLEGLMEPPAKDLIDQLALFRGADIVLTAGLLAGGSDGLARIIDALKELIENLKARRRAETRAANAPFSPAGINPTRTP